MADENEAAAIIRILINDPKLDRYFHADVRPERKPLVIALEGAPAAALKELRKFDMPVQSRATEQAAGPVLSITIGKAVSGETQVHFSYAVEGISGRAIFSKEDGRPVLKDISVSER